MVILNRYGILWCCILLSYRPGLRNRLSCRSGLRGRRSYRPIRTLRTRIIRPSRTTTMINHGVGHVSSPTTRDLDFDRAGFSFHEESRPIHHIITTGSSIVPRSVSIYFVSLIVSPCTIIRLQMQRNGLAVSSRGVICASVIRIQIFAAGFGSPKRVIVHCP